MGVPKYISDSQEDGVTQPYFCIAIESQPLGKGGSRVPARSRPGSRMPAEGGQ